MSPFSKEPGSTTEHYYYLCSAAELETSYARCRALKVPVELDRPQKILQKILLYPRLAENSLLLTAVEQVITPDYCAGSQNDHIYLLCDPGLVALKLFAAPEVLVAAEDVAVKPGTVFTEESCGTNALALAREHKRIRAIRGEQHFCKLFKDWWCVAAPVKDPSGTILGYLDISMHAAKELGLTVALLKMILIAIEKEFLLRDFLYRHQSGAISPTPSLPDEAQQELTSREREVLRLLFSGLTNEEIAKELCLSTRTVETYQKNIYRKLGASSFRELLRKLQRK